MNYRERNKQSYTMRQWKMAEVVREFTESPIKKSHSTWTAESLTHFHTGMFHDMFCWLVTVQVINAIMKKTNLSCIFHTSSTSMCEVICSS